MNVSKVKYIENKKEQWREEYDIPFHQEFNLGYMLDTEFELLNIRPDHSKTKIDLTKIYSELHSNLLKNIRRKAKHKLSEENKRRVYLLLDYSHQIKEFGKVLKLMADYSDNIKKTRSINGEYMIETTNTVITIAKKDSSLIRGKRAEVFYSLSDVTREFMGN